MIDLEAIRARDATQFEMYHKSCHDRRALLKYVDELREAAGKVQCENCHGSGFKAVRDEGALTHTFPPCPDCADLRRLLGEKP